MLVLSCRPKSLGDCIFVDCSDSISAGILATTLLVKLSARYRMMQFSVCDIHIYDSFGIMKGGKRPERDRGLGGDVEFIALKDDQWGEIEH